MIPSVLVWGPAGPGPSATSGGTPDNPESVVNFQDLPHVAMPRFSFWPVNSVIKINF